MCTQSCCGGKGVGWLPSFSDCSSLAGNLTFQLCPESSQPSPHGTGHPKPRALCPQSVLFVTLWGPGPPAAQGHPVSRLTAQPPSGTSTIWGLLVLHSAGLTHSLRSAGGAQSFGISADEATREGRGPLMALEFNEPGEVCLCKSPAPYLHT